MSTRKKLVVINISGLIGIIVSLFIAPPATPLWLWALTSTIVLALFNYVALTGRRKPQDDSDRNGSWGTVVIASGFGVLLLELALRYLHK